MALVVPGGKLIDGGDASGDLTSLVMDIQGHAVVGVHCVSASDARAGTIEVQVSNDNANWVDVEFADGSSVITVTASTALNAFVDLYGLGAKYLRVHFTDSASGSGSLTVTAVRKSQGRG